MSAIAHIISAPCAGKITGPLPWEDASDKGSPPSAPSPLRTPLQQRPSGDWRDTAASTPVWGGGDRAAAAEGEAHTGAAPLIHQATIVLLVVWKPLKRRAPTTQLTRYSISGCSCSCIPEGVLLLAHASSISIIAEDKGGSPPRSMASSEGIPDYVGADLATALSTPERLRPDSAWSLDVNASLVSTASRQEVHFSCISTPFPVGFAIDACYQDIFEVKTRTPSVCLSVPSRQCPWQARPVCSASTLNF